jgi:hypothetical protein
MNRTFNEHNKIILAAINAMQNYTRIYYFIKIYIYILKVTIPRKCNALAPWPSGFTIPVNLPGLNLVFHDIKRKFLNFSLQVNVKQSGLLIKAEFNT